MLAKNLVHQAAQRGANAVFTTASDLLLDLSKQETARALERRLRYYTQPQVLAIDEVGYLSYDNHAADLLFQIVSRRYERRSIVLTTNLAFSEWNTVFPNAACATALSSAAAILLVHNHPSNDVTPSPEDLELTGRLARGGELLDIRVLEHLIVGNGDYRSLREAAHLDN
jgi:DNA replication protein DnaC